MPRASTTSALETRVWRWQAVSARAWDLAVAGQRSENNSFSIDGVNNDNHEITGPMTYVSNEAVSQISVLQNQFSPEFGGASGGVFNVIVKSGTNQLHGSIYEYLQNRDLNAVDNTDVLTETEPIRALTATASAPPLAGRLKGTSCSTSETTSTIPSVRRPMPNAPVYAPTAAGIALLNGMTGLSKTNLGHF